MCIRPFAAAKFMARYLYFLSFFTLLSCTAGSAAENLTKVLELPGVWAGKAAWADYDNDGYLDLAMIGEVGEEGVCRRVARLFKNSGASGGGVLDPEAAQELTGVYYGDLAWADYNGDGYLDLAIGGWDENGDETLKLYANDGLGNLSLDQEEIAIIGTSGLEGVRYASLAWADYDGDSDPDLVVAGMGTMGVSLTQLYRNDDGELVLDQANSEAVLNFHNGDLAWADYDNDGDPDLSISGDNVSSSGGLYAVTEFYLNDPIGTLDRDASIELINPLTRAPLKLKGGALAWADYDDDGNLDLAVSGRNYYWEVEFVVFQNKPTGLLTGIDMNTQFAGSTNNFVAGDLAWVDYDNDGDPDLVSDGVPNPRSAGILQRSDYLSVVYENEEGKFSTTETLDHALAGGSVVWGDYDRDGRIDLLSSGVNLEGQRRAVLYHNEVLEVNAAPAPPAALKAPLVTGTQVLFSWWPGSDDKSERLTYNLSVGTEERSLEEQNDGALSPTSDDIFSGSAGVAPGNNGFSTDRLLKGTLPTRRYYWSVQSVDASLARSAWSPAQVLFVEPFVGSDQRLRDLWKAEMSWGDYDSDGDYDLAIMGEDRNGDRQTLIYENDSGTLRERQDFEILGAVLGDLAWGDADNDGDLDLLVSGAETAEVFRTRIYANDSGSLLLRENLDEVYYSAAAWGDADNDGDLDLVLQGQKKDATSLTRVYFNDGQAGLDPAIELPGLHNGEVAWADYDVDGDLDLAVAGIGDDRVPALRLYSNEGRGQLSAANSSSLTGIQSSDLAWGDYDGDGDADLATSGFTASNEKVAILYQNQGSGEFSAVEGTTFPGFVSGDLTWGDYDNDQYMDLFLVGAGMLSIHRNLLGGLTTPDIPFERDASLDNLQNNQGLTDAAVSLVDIDGDGDLDLVSAGRNASNTPQTLVNDNITAFPNEDPQAPAITAAEDSVDTVELSWEGAVDSPAEHVLTYNVRVGTGGGVDNVLSGNTPLGPGNAGANSSYRLHDLTSGTYLWSVQSVDDALGRSGWTAARSFIIDTVRPQVSSYNISGSKAGIGQTLTLALGFEDEHSGVDTAIEPLITATIGASSFPFEQLQFTGTSWSGQLTITAAMPSGPATIAVDNLFDHRSNSVMPFSAVDAFEVDTEIPTVLEQFPAAAAAGVSSATSELTITFSEPIEPETVSDANFQIKLDSRALDLVTVPEYDEGTRTVTLRPASGLLPGHQYAVEVSAAVQDLFGNRPGNAISWNFSTQVPDTTAVAPLAGASEVALDDNDITVTFDAPIFEGALAQEGAVQVFREGKSAILDGDPIWDKDEKTLRIALSEAWVSALNPGSRYEVRLSGLLGGSLRLQEKGDFRWSFDTVVPSISRRIPAAGEEEVAISDASIKAFFDHHVDRAEVENEDNFKLLREGEEVEIGELIYLPADRTLSFEPEAGILHAGTSYQVRLPASLGGPLREEDYSWVFTTAIPELSSIDPAAGATGVSTDLPEVLVTFTAPIDDDRVDTIHFSLLRNGQPVSLATGYPAGRGANQYALAPAGGWDVGSTYRVQVAPSVTGPLGTEQTISSQFQTKVPSVLEQVPVAGASDIATLASQIRVVFDDAVDAEAVSLLNIQLLLEGQAVAISDPSYDPSDFSVTFFPEADLLAGSSYYVRLAAALGGPLRADDYIWPFTTAIPRLSSIVPEDQDQGVSTASLDQVVVVFTAPIDSAQAIADNFVLLREGVPVPLRPNDPVPLAPNKYGLAPAAEWQVGSIYTVQIAPVVSGPLGGGQTISSTFQTAVPQVVQLDPPAGATGVPTAKSIIRAVFDNPLDKIAAGEVASIQLLQEGRPVDIEALAYSSAADSSTLSFSPVGGLITGTPYQVRIDARVGGPLRQELGDFVWDFTTRVPALVRSTPADGAEGVSTRSPTIQLFFSDPVASQNPSGFQLFHRLLGPGSQPGVPNPTSLVEKIQFVPGDSVISFSPRGGLQPFSEYKVLIGREVLGSLSTGGDSLIFRTASQLENVAGGGSISNPGGKVELYFPPNAIVGGAEIRIRRLEEEEIAAKVAVQDVELTRISAAYEIVAGDATLSKPVTLTMRYTSAQLGEQKSDRLAIFRLENDTWERIGGTVEVGKKQVATAIEELGIYAIFEDLSTPAGALAIRKLNCQPRAFSPLVGGKSETDISFELTQAADVTVRIYNAAGRLERVVERGTPMSPGRILLSWDGRDEDREAVSSGLYIVVVDASGVRREKIVAVVR